MLNLKKIKEKKHQPKMKLEKNLLTKKENFIFTGNDSIITIKICKL